MKLKELRIGQHFGAMVDRPSSNTAVKTQHYLVCRKLFSSCEVIRTGERIVLDENHTVERVK